MERESNTSEIRALSDAEIDAVEGGAAFLAVLGAGIAIAQGAMLGVGLGVAGYAVYHYATR